MNGMCFRSNASIWWSLRRRIEFSYGMGRYEGAQAPLFFTP